MKLYAVTKGCYSDYHIITLTTRRDRAERLAKLYSDQFEEAIVEAYEEGDIDDHRIPYEVYFYTSGNVTPYTRNFDEWDPGELMKVIAYDNAGIGPEYRVLVLASSKELAVKIACDQLAQYKAEKEGIW